MHDVTDAVVLEELLLSGVRNQGVSRVVFPLADPGLTSIIVTVVEQNVVILALRDVVLLFVYAGLSFSDAELRDGQPLGDVREYHLLSVGQLNLAVFVRSRISTVNYAQLVHRTWFFLWPAQPSRVAIHRFCWGLSAKPLAGRAIPDRRWSCNFDEIVTVVLNTEQPPLESLVGHGPKCEQIWFTRWGARLHIHLVFRYGCICQSAARLRRVSMHGDNRSPRPCLATCF